MTFEEKLLKRIETFWGYGNINSDYWFIGMEEGLGDDDDDFINRINNTFDKQVVDAVDGMCGVKDALKWFQGSIPLQNTWKILIRIKLIIDGIENVNVIDMKSYQKDKFARSTSDHCTLELMPLPSKSISKKDWFYDKYKIGILKDRDYYLEQVKPQRIKNLTVLLNKILPKVVIFYSFNYLEDWKKIIPGTINKIAENIYFFENEIKYFVIPHPCMHGMSSSGWNKIGKIIKDKIH